MAEPRKAVVLGLSGCSSSGKTTLARLLRDIFPNTFVLHEDDFYKAETELPTKNGLLDWDCAEALSIPNMQKSLEHIHTNGTFPPDLDSKEDQNSIGACPVPDHVINEMKTYVSHWSLREGSPGYGIMDNLRLCVFDGFLLYTPALKDIQPLIDIKVLLRVSYAKAKARREARSGYVTLEGFWEDPPGYVDKIVWPNYVADHAFMYEQGDVEGDLKADVVQEWGIKFMEGGVDIDMSTILKWMVELLMLELPKFVKK